MGYTHYWQRKQEFKKEAFEKAACDFRKLLPRFSRFGIKLAGADGRGQPRIDKDVISFNGSEQCGHSNRFELLIPWPTEQAGGIAREVKEALAGGWLGGCLIDQRACGGGCSYETFQVDRVLQPEKRLYLLERNGRYSEFCKTAFRPYDLVVTACLVILKYCLPGEILVQSDGE